MRVERGETEMDIWLPAAFRKGDLAVADRVDCRNS